MEKYVTDSKLQIVMDRKNESQYKKQEKIKSKFEVYDKPTDTCGNVRAYFKENGQCVIGDYTKDQYIDSYRQISSALALYRTISLFECGITNEVDFYKMNWSVRLRHKESGKYLVLGEWKGGFQIFTEGHSAKSLPKSFVLDTQDLLELITSVDMVIGYDGTVAGSVA